MENFDADYLYKIDAKEYTLTIDVATLDSTLKVDRLSELIEQLISQLE